MSRIGLRVATRFGSQLPAFRDLAEAEWALFRQRDQVLQDLTELSPHSASFRPDFSPESLKALERWYIDVLDGGGFDSIQSDEESFARAVAMYFGEVLVRNNPSFEWFVAEFAFARGRYEIGVRRPQYSVMLSRMSPAPRERNRRAQSLWRTYRHHAG